MEKYALSAQLCIDEHAIEVHTMSKYQLVPYCDPPVIHFEYRTAARLARVTTKFVQLCECEELISCCIMTHGKKGLAVTEIRTLKLIRHLHEDMGLDLEAVDFVLKYRNRINSIQRRMEDMKKQMHDNQIKYKDEILELRRHLAELSDQD